MLFTALSTPIRSLARAGLRCKSTLTVHEAASDCRQLALPLAFLAWDQTHAQVFKPWIERFGEAGYTSLLIALDPAEAAERVTAQGGKPTSQAILAHLESEMSSLLSSSVAGSFPPLLIAHSLSTLPAQTYVSSHPLSGLLLHTPVSPPTTAHEQHPELFPSPLEEFTFEPGFPVAVMHAEGARALGEERLVRDFDSEDVQRVKGGMDGRGWQEAMEWIDEVGL